MNKLFYSFPNPCLGKMCSICSLSFDRACPEYTEGLRMTQAKNLKHFSKFKDLENEQI